MLETSDSDLDESNSEGDDKLNLLTKKFSRNLKIFGCGKSRRLKREDKGKVVCYEGKKPC